MLCQMREIDRMSRGGMPWPQTGATHYHAQLGLPDQGQAIKGLDVCNSWDLEPGPRLASSVAVRIQTNNLILNHYLKP